jgi:hypothetical protein
MVQKVVMSIWRAWSRHASVNDRSEFVTERVLIIGTDRERVLFIGHRERVVYWIGCEFVTGSVLFIGTQFSKPYTAVDTPARAA